MTKKDKYRIFFWILVAALILWNIAWPLAASVRARLYRSTSSRKYNGSFHARYVADKSILNPDADSDYVPNPILWPYVILGSNAVVEVRITSNTFVVAMEAAHGHTTESYSIGKDVFYLGDGLFAFYSSDFGLGMLSPGTVYSATACKVTVSDKAVSVDAEETHVGLSFFLFPVVQKRTFRRSLQGIGGSLAQPELADESGGETYGMKESYAEGLASHTGPESCVDLPLGDGEALTGESTGGLLSSENTTFRESIR